MTHYSASVAKCRRLSVSWSLLFGLAVLSLRIVTVWAQDEEGTDQTEHAALIEELEIDFDSLQQSGEVDLSSDDPVVAAHNALQPMLGNLEDRLAALFAKTSTTECRAKIARHFNYFVAAIGKEEGLPFADSTFVNECPEPVYDWYNLPEGIHVGHIQNRTYQPPRNESVYIEPEELRLLYAVLAHDDPASTIRLMDALYEPGHLFVIHVDGKEASDETYRQLVDYAATRDHVHVLCAARRVRVNWGGFSMVNATLQILHYAFCVDEVDCTPLEFHKVVHLASSSYPLASNTEIRSTITDYPLDANFLHVILKPLRPPRTSWSYFVECDDFVHRIYRLESLQNSTSGMELYTSSQWFIMSREFAEYIAEARPGTFVHQFLEYVQHVVVADETFFGTVLRHTKFCTTHHNSNFLHLQFDRWESDLPEGKRDERKCMMKDPDHCGRSPTTMTTDYADILELTSDLFARKFVDLVDSQVKDIVDEWRVKREADPEAIKNFQQKGLGFEGHGVLIVAKDTVQDEVPLCLGLGDTGNKLKLVPCFYEEVVPSLADEWETGAVILEETQWHNRWQVGPCTSDGAVQRNASAQIEVTPGKYSATGPRCMFSQMDGAREGRCIDTDSGSNQPGGEAHVFPCVKRWYQFLSFGDGNLAPANSLFVSMPSHVVRQIHNLGHEHIAQMCLGVYQRGTKDETDWEEKDESSDPTTASEAERALIDEEDLDWPPLSQWLNEQVITTQCTNEGAVIEWLFVPFIVEDEPLATNGSVPEADGASGHSSPPKDAPGNDEL